MKSAANTESLLGAVMSTIVGTAATAQQAEQSSPAPIEEVVVTGSYLQRFSEHDAVSPLDIVTQDEIAALGINELSEIVERLTINTGSQNNPDAFTQNLSTGTTNVNLRGLGVGTTLVLVNGRRQTVSAVTTDRGESFVDTSSLPPLIALDRIEILQDGAAALYGSDAVGGVMNLITRDRFHGLDLRLNLQSAHPLSHSERRLSALFGAADNRTHYLAAFSMLRRGSLSAAERRFSGPHDDLSQAGNPGSYVASLDPGSSPRVFADPDCDAIATSDKNVVPTIIASVIGPIGEIPVGLCQFDFGDFYALVPEERQRSGYFGLTSDLGNSIEARADFHTAENESLRSNSPSFPFADFPRIVATHPDNPFGTEVLFIGRLLGSHGLAAESLHKSDTRRGSLGLSGDLSERWTWNTGMQRSTNTFIVAASDVLADRFDLAVRGLGGAGCSAQADVAGNGDCVYFNPFGSSLTGTGTSNSPELLAHLVAPFQLSATSELTTLDAVLTGALPRLGRIAIGGERRKERISYRYDDNSRRENFMFFTGATDFNGARNATAIFAELALPIAETVTLQVAARREDHGDLRSTNPKVSLLWRPTSRVTLRSSIGSSFRAPSLFQTAGTQTSLAELVDPAVGVAQFFPVRTQPNPNGRGLKPEHGNTYHLSVDWTPVSSLRLNLAYWSFDYRDVIIRQSPQALLTTVPQSSAQVERDRVSGALLRINTYYDNASSLKTAGFDLSMVSSFDTANAGSVEAGLAATLTTTYDLVDPQLGFIAGAGRRNFENFATSVPRLRSNIFLDWRRGHHDLNLRLNYIGAYIDDEAASDKVAPSFRRIEDRLTIDLQYRLRMTKRVAVTIGAFNLFDSKPPYVATNGGYDSKVHDPRGRQLYLRALVEI